MKFYLTTPIYYVNDQPHIGHAYTTVAADALARYHRFCGEEVFFLTGSDEHGQKIELAAQAKGETPQQLTDRVVRRFQELWKTLGIEYDRFIRTTENSHKAFVQQFFRRVQQNGDIYLGEYEGWYCVPDETFFTETQVGPEKKCPDCGRAVTRTREPSYFFRMSKYQERLLRHIEENPAFIAPPEKRNEVLSFVREGLRDLSISRTSFSWGIPVPGDEKHIIYVWFDALLNYLSGPANGKEGETSGFWPADLHLLGKDILRHHAVYWPTFLMSAGLPLPKQIFAHGWWTVDGDKMSKSKGNVVDPAAVVGEFGVDPCRYFLLREFPFGADGDYSHHAIVGRINSELANDLGNLANRALNMVEKYRGAVAPRAGGSDVDRQFAADVRRQLASYHREMKALSFQQALGAALEVVRRSNHYIDQRAPWALAKGKREEELDAVLANLLLALRLSAVLFYPVMPQKMQSLWERLGERQPLAAFRFAAAEFPGVPEGTKVCKGEPLFPRLEA